MNLDNFESFIEERIMTRGFDYYEDGHVTDLEQVAQFEFSATVYGTEEYTVYIKFQDDDFTEILDYSCNCPYDWGDTCKHTVATMYAIREGDLVLPSGSGNTITALKSKLEY